MAKKSKKYVEALNKIDRTRLYDATEALSLVAEVATAKFDETQLFPSHGNVEVTNIVFSFPCVFINWIFVLNVLKTSEIGDFGS